MTRGLLGHYFNDFHWCKVLSLLVHCIQFSVLISRAKVGLQCSFFGTDIQHRLIYKLRRPGIKRD